MNFSISSIDLIDMLQLDIAFLMVIFHRSILDQGLIFKICGLKESLPRYSATVGRGTGQAGKKLRDLFYRKGRKGFMHGSQGVSAPCVPCASLATLAVSSFLRAQLGQGRYLKP